MSKPKCGAKTRSGKPCGYPAGYKTDHPGEGKCYLHGGRTPIKHGRYSKISGNLGDKIAEHANNPNPLDLLPELATLRALFERWIEAGGEEGSAETVAGAEKLIDGMRKTVDTIHKMQTRELLTSREMEMGLMEISRIIAEEVKDPEIIAHIAKRISASFSLHAADKLAAITGE